MRSSVDQHGISIIYNFNVNFVPPRFLSTPGDIYLFNQAIFNQSAFKGTMSSQDGCRLQKKTQAISILLVLSHICLGTWSKNYAAVREKVCFFLRGYVGN
jgi:hypothetical protein